MAPAQSQMPILGAAPNGTSQANPEYGGPPTFLGLPLEVRIQIYKQIFVGSRMVFQPRQLPSGFHIAVKTFGHWEILLACKTCYEEGRSIFIDQVRLYMTCYNKSQLPLLSTFTRENLRHLRCEVEFPDEEHQFFSILAHFPSLKTCGFGAVLTGTDKFQRGWKEMVADTEVRDQCIAQKIESHFSDNFKLLMYEMAPSIQFLFHLEITNMMSIYHGDIRQTHIMNLTTKKQAQVLAKPGQAQIKTGDIFLPVLCRDLSYV